MNNISPGSIVISPGSIIAAVIGGFLFGPIGGLVGWFLFSGALSAAFEKLTTPEKLHGGNKQKGEPTTVMLAALMALVTVVAKADGHFTREELAVVRAFLRRHYPTYAQECLNILKNLVRMNVPRYRAWSVAKRIALMMPNRQDRTALLQFLVEIASADGVVSEEEYEVLISICNGLGLSRATLDSLLAMSGSNQDSAKGGGEYAEGNSDSDYAILGISPSATDSEVKKAFRRLAMKHHPDKVASCDAATQRAATERFKKINAAYERICKRRGSS